ncbi:flagellar basal body L-ring protein [Legionella israelensis]|uniref:flagellar basal body L-ring protein FlgH n=1 Tax=Legionella israelensis TaxID=454 RepID=UPI00117E06F9|nr:flagellar basal body L-ring protein FlgH [Legionella israelensis]QDP73440.1 flagellar basal body L-ring protein [Legionella israelensis]
MKKWFVICCLFLGGCAEPVIYPPALPMDVPPPPKRNGSIYQPGYAKYLYSDKIASHIGDVLTVRLEESTRGEYRAKTKTDKRASLDYPVPIFFGHRVPELEVQTDTEQRFDGKGDSDQRDRLTGTMTVTVMNVLSNGNLVIQGESWVTINQGRKYMRIRGIVRQEDITTDNTISSQRIADAQITYGAAGQAGYATRGGLVTRLFNRFALY